MSITSNFWIDGFLMAVVFPCIGFMVLSLAARGFRDVRRYDEDRMQSAVNNIVLFYINGVVNGLVFAGIAKAAKAGMAGYIPQVDPDIWTGLPLVVTTLIALIALDFSNYWNHRLLHTKPIWGIHAVHHSDQHMSWTTSYRVHVLEGFLMALGVALLAGWLNLPVAAIGVAAAVHGMYNKYVHCQLEWTHGPLRKWLISPNYHRWHHADTPAAYNKNFGDIFAIWDRLFGTHYDPEICRENIGLPDGPHTLPHMLVYPFQYWYREYLSKIIPFLRRPAEQG